MKLKTYALIAGLLSLTFHSFGNGLEITNVTPNDDYTQLSFDISWENSWRQTERFHDAVWVFVKYRPDNSSQWDHAGISGGAASGQLELLAQDDKIGVFIRNKSDYSGDISPTPVTLFLEIDTTLIVYPDFQVFGIEMVYVPSGSFFFGDGTPGRYAALEYEFSSDDFFPDQWNAILEIEDSTRYNISRHDEKPVVNTIIPANFPNGTRQFYVMKHPVTQGLMSDFLTSIINTSKLNVHPGDRPLEGDSITEFKRQSIYRDDSNPDSIVFGPDGNRNRIINEPDDGQSVVALIPNTLLMYKFLDWSGLRPMTEMEYEKVCRGPLKPVTGEYAWGDNLKLKQIQFPELLNKGLEDETYPEHGSTRSSISDYSTVARAGINAGPGFSRLKSSASFWGVLDLSNYKPFLISIRHPQMRAENGDGLLQTEPFSWSYQSDRTIPVISREETVSNYWFPSPDEEGWIEVPVGYVSAFTFWGVRTP